VVADLPQAIQYTLTRLQAQAAIAADVRHLMDALPALTRVARYGDVRGTRTEYVLPIIHGLFERIVVGLPGACASLDDEAAEGMVTSIAKAQQSLDLLDNPGHRSEWKRILVCLSDNESIHGLVRGWCCRLLLEQRALGEEELHRRTRLALSPAVPVLQAASWIEGLLRGSGLVLLHQDSLWLALDHWLADISAETFVELLPILRRSFAGFQFPERRAMAEKVKKLGIESQARTAATASSSTNVMQQGRVDLVLPVLAQVLGVKWEPKK
jgi:hypothetical protein